MFLGGMLEEYLIRAIRNLFFGMMALLSGIAVAHSAPGAEVFGAIPAMRFPAISPDGKHLAAIEPENGKPAVLVFDLDTPTAKPTGFVAPEMLPFGLTWMGNDRVIGLFSTEKVEGEDTGLHLRGFVRAISMSITGGTPVVLMSNSNAYRVNNGNLEFDGPDPGHPGSALMSGYDYNGNQTEDTRFSQQYFNFNLYTVDAESGSYKLIESGNQNTQSWLTGSKGQAVARLDSAEVLKGYLYVRDGSSWRKALTIDESAGFDFVPVGVTADDNGLLIERYGSSNTLELDSFALSGSNVGPAVYTNPKYDIQSEVTDPWTGQIVGVSYVDDLAQFIYFQPDLVKIENSLKHALPGESVELVSWDKARDRFIVSTEGPKEPRIYNLFTPATGLLSPLASEFPTIQSSDLGDKKPYSYKAQDGLAIPAYITLPPGKVAKNLPMVVFPHGGPESRDDMSFDWWAQFMATRGYVIFQPNFRGSSGYGSSFRDAGFNQWGRKMQDDISDGVRKLIADGIADPKRICIVGASYGGYAALAGATFTPDLYACAVSFSGVSDVSSLIGNVVQTAGKESPSVAYWESRIGDRFKDSKYLAEVSPALHADKVKAPVLLLHCSNDLTVPIVQSQIELMALQKAGKLVQFVNIEGDDHYMRQTATRVRVLQEIDKFLAANIGN